jgi:hypothetical protein
MGWRQDAQEWSRFSFLALRLTRSPVQKITRRSNCWRNLADHRLTTVAQPPAARMCPRGSKSTTHKYPGMTIVGNEWNAAEAGTPPVKRAGIEFDRL